jgi:hypothetical protein
MHAKAKQTTLKKCEATMSTEGKVQRSGESSGAALDMEDNRFRPSPGVVRPYSLAER